MNPDDKKVIEALKESAENVEVPSSLEPSAILSRLKGAEDENVKSQDAEPANKRSFSDRFKVHRGRRMQVAMAACLAILCGVGLLAAGVLGNRYHSGDTISEPVLTDSSDASVGPQAAGDVSRVPVAKSYKQLYNRFNSEGAASYSEGRFIERDISGELRGGEIEDIPDIPISGLTDTSKEGNLATASGDYSQTNVRTEGVDEADIVKTDGKVIYSLQNFDSSLSLVKVDSGKMETASTIKARDVTKSGGDFCEFFVSDNRLYLIANVYGNSSYDNTYTKVATYDVSDPSKPRLIGTVEQAGYYNTARLVDGHLYLFTNFYPDYAAKKSDLESYVPKVKGEVLACEDVYIPSCSWGLEYMVLGAINVEEPTAIEQTRAVLCGSDRVYVSNDGIYVYGQSRKAFASRDISLDYAGEAGDATAICKFSYKDGNIEPVGEALVLGYIDDGFSIDEYEGNTRVVTTSEGDNGKTSNNVFVLNGELKEIGSLTDVAPGEQVYAARFMGNIAYFVTYRQTDPLFSVDLSDPTHPTIIGQLKIPGFSEYLHPWGEGRMLGIGMATRKNGTVTDGVKLTMFDTSDPSNVREIDTFILKGMYYSDALYDYRAVYADMDRGLVGFFAEDSKAYYYLFSYSEQDGFSVKIRDQIPQAYGYGARGVSISDNFYVAAQGLMNSYNMADFEKISQIKL